MAINVGDFVIELATPWPHSSKIKDAVTREGAEPMMITAIHFMGGVCWFTLTGGEGKVDHLPARAVKPVAI